MLPMESGFNLLKSWFKKAESKPSKTIKMCVLGLDNAGKTTILKALLDEEIQYVMPT